MIEIVLVLVLLGILAAVAIPKYFDLQESGRVKVCEHNRAVIASTIEKQETLARYSKDVGIFDYKSQTGAAASAQHILNDMYPAGQKETACPSGGIVTIKTTPAGNDKGFYFTVACSIHAPGSMIVTRTDGMAFVDWFKSAFHDPMDLGSYKSLTDLFVRGTGAELDSEAGNYKTTLTAVVAGAMANAGLTSATSFGASAEKDGVDAETARAVAEKSTYSSQTRRMSMYPTRTIASTRPSSR